MNVTGDGAIDVIGMNLALIIISVIGVYDAGANNCSPLLSVRTVNFL